MDDNFTPDLRVLEPGDEAAFEAFLMPHLASSMFLLGNVRSAGLTDTGDRFSGTYMAAFEDGQMVGVVAHFWNGTLMPQVPAPWTERYLDVLWHAAVNASGRSVKGVVGPDDQACAIKAALAYPPDIVQMDLREKLYELDLAALVVPEALRSGQVTARRAVLADVDLLVHWRVGYETETMDATDTPSFRAEVRANQTRIIGDRSVWILEDAGVPVATTGFNADLGEVVQVGGVYTPPEKRSRGYARCAVAASLLDAREAGATRGILFTGEQNIAAQKAYTALGFQQVGTFRLCLLREGVAV
jgi:RimJ/RimL family protein N-acetyltransferase